VAGGQASTPGRPWPAIATIPCPTLIVRGLETDVLPLYVAQRMVQVMPKAQLAHVEQAAHMVMEENPEGFSAWCGTSWSAPRRRPATKHGGRRKHGHDPLPRVWRVTISARTIEDVPDTRGARMLSSPAGGASREVWAARYHLCAGDSRGRTTATGAGNMLPTQTRLRWV